MKQISFLIVFLLGTVFLFSQENFTVSGKVIDSATRSPLSSASVFCQNTTQGTATNSNGEFSLSLRPGGYDLIITYSGYKRQIVRISQNEQTTDLTIEMKPADKDMEEIIIKSSAEVTDGWEKHGDFFIENFIGSSMFAKQCVLQNRDVVHFFYYKKNERLKIKADEPLVIINNALGYTMRYQLDSFVYRPKENLISYRGFCLFEEMQGTRQQMKEWMKNRREAYYGSKLHFMHSYYDKTLTEEGFYIAELDSKDDTKFNRFTKPYDSVYYMPVDSTKEVDIRFPKRISVTFTKRTPEDSYLKKFNLPNDVGVQVSYIDVLDVVTIQENGYYYDQKDWINFGYWSWKNIGDLLPYDYVPG